MKKWHETVAANIGLRALGIILVGIGWLFALRLHHMALITGPRDPGAPMIILSAATFLSASAGSALLFVGPGLWETVEVSVRWRRLPPGVPDTAIFPRMGCGESRRNPDRRTARRITKTLCN